MTPARARSPGICLLSLPFHTWAVAALAGVSALAVMPPGRPEDAITAYRNRGAGMTGVFLPGEGGAAVFPWLEGR